MRRLKTADHVTYQLTQNMDWRALIEDGAFAADTAKDDSNEVTEVRQIPVYPSAALQRSLLKGMNAGRIRSTDLYY